MLERFDGKEVRVTLEGGEVLAGPAESYPSGYGLHVFGREEESLLIEDAFVFKSEIAEIGLLEDEGANAVLPKGLNELMGELLEGPYCVVDVLPKQVPRDAPGQYFAVERYWLGPERLGELRRKFAEVLLRLNCYFDMAVSFDNCESWELNPEPEGFAARLVGLSGNVFLRAVFAARRSMVDIDPCDANMTAYGTDAEFLDVAKQAASAEGLFVWTPEGE